jgi:hypothetical protein
MQYFRADGIDHGKPGCRAIRSPRLDVDAEPATPPRPPVRERFSRVVGTAPGT